MLPLLVLALFLGACAVQPAPRTEPAAPEITISPTAEAYVVEQSSDGQQWTALAETAAASWVRVKRAVTPPQSSGTATLYVDGALPQASCTTYSVQNRNCAGTDGRAYQTWQGAAAVVVPGDVVEVRAGTYALQPRAEIVLSRSGTAEKPIRWRSRAGELVTINGPYNTDAKATATCAAGNGIRDWDENCVDDPDGHADGPSDPEDRARLIHVSGSWNVLTGVRLQWGYRCLRVSGHDNVIEENVMTDCWNGVVAAVVGDRNTFRYNVFARGRHRAGFEITKASETDGGDTNVLYRNFSYHNGRHCVNADCSQVARTRSSTLGDDTNASNTPGGYGGENSDGFISLKDCRKEPPGTNLCNGNSWVENIAWDSVDGGYDHSERNGTWIANIFVRGATGFKMYGVSTPDTGNTWSGWMFLDGGSESRGGEYRSGGNSRVLHSLALRNGSNGGHRAATTSGSGNLVHNTLGYLDAGSELHFDAPPWTLSNNWDGDKQGDPKLTDAQADFIGPLQQAQTCLQNAPHQVTVASCFLALWRGLTAPLKPAAGSPLIDKGVVVAGYHCATADDAATPEPPSSACRHWTGAAPDIGPFEWGYEGNNGSDNPDKSRCSVAGGC